MKAVGWLGAALLLGVACAAPAGAQDSDPGHWSATPGTTLRLTWDYSFDEKTDATKEGKRYRRETRKVTALAVSKQGFRGTGRLELTLETVEWTVDTEDYTVKVRLASKGGEPTVDQTIKDPDTEGAASQEAEEMQDYCRATYRLLVRPGRKAIQVKSGKAWAGGGTAASIFDRCYVHSDLPEDDVKSTMRWTDEREAEFLPLYSEPGRVEQYPKVKLKLHLGDGVASAKGGGKANFKGLTPFNWQYAGKSNLKREFTCSAKKHTLESSEEATSRVKREDQTERGRMSGQMTVKQSLTLAPAN